MLLDRHIAREVLLGIGLVFALLATVFLLGDLIEEMEDIGRARYEYVDAISVALLRAPQRAYELLPVATLIGALLGLGWLAQSGEITAMRAAGASRLRLTRAVMQAGLIVIIAGFVSGEWLVPRTERIAHEWRVGALTGSPADAARGGAGNAFWGRDEDGFVLLGRIPSERRLHDIRMFELDGEGRLASASHANSARRFEDVNGATGDTSSDDPDTGTWRLEEIETSRFRHSAPEDGAEEGNGVAPPTVDAESIAERAWELPASAARLARLARRGEPPEWHSLAELAAQAKFLRESGLRAAEHEAVLWSRIVAPFGTAAMLFAALALMLGPLRLTPPRLRLAMGAMLGIGFHIVRNVAIESGVVYEWSAPLPALAPIAALVLLGAWWLRRRAAA